MKAVIMAGGRGTRLNPLTYHLPKPMVPLLDKPCMEYIIDLLKAHGITEIAVTLQYLPQIIKNHFGDGAEYGVHLHYFEETAPLGTAGSVKNAEEFLNETFLVISGDSLTDFNLSQAIAYHKEKQAIGTLILTRVDVPLEYGVAMTGNDGKIIRFLEKPSWSEVFSDTVNTGIYVLEPDILQFVGKGETFDFSKDLFPLMLKKALPLYGFVAEGYWSDIGNLGQYQQTQFDMLKGLVNVQIKGTEAFPGIWIGSDVKLQENIDFKGPAYIGDGTIVEEYAQIGPYTVLGRYNRVEKKVSVERSIIWNRNYLGQCSRLIGTTLCNGIKVGVGTSINEHSVVGEKCWLGDSSVIKPYVKIWPEKKVEASTIQQSSLIWGKSASQGLFGESGITGIPNLELTPEKVGKICSAYGSCLKRGATVSVSSDEYPYSLILKFSVISSLMAIGINIRDIGSTLAPIARYECRHAKSDGGIHIRKSDGSDKGTITIELFDQEGLPIDKGMERKIENAYMQEDFPRPEVNQLGIMEQSSPVVKSYIDEILRKVNVTEIRKRNFKVVFSCHNRQAINLVFILLERLGCQVLMAQNSSLSLGQSVINNHADIGIMLDSSCQTFGLISDEGRFLTEAEATVLLSLINLKRKVPLAIPVTAPSIIENISESTGIPVVRTKALSRSLLEVGKMNSLQVHYDDFYSLVTILEHMAREGGTLQEIMDRLPKFYMSMDMVECPIESKGRVMRKLMEDIKDENLELIDGIKVLLDDAWALVLPDSEKAFFRVVAQGCSRHRADELAKLYKKKISYYQQVDDL